MNSPSSTPQFLSFVELESAESVTPAIIVQTLDEYVVFGSAIVAQTVIDLAGKCEMTPGDWMKIENHAKKGAEYHERERNSVAVKEYRDLEAYATGKIDFGQIGQATTERVGDVLKASE